MPKKNNNILKFNKGNKSLRMLFIVYTDTESLPEKISSCEKNPETSFNNKITQHEPFEYFLVHTLFI